MEIKGNVTIKKNFTENDYANVVETIVSFIIRKEEDRTISYTPYYRGVGEIVAVSKHLLDGISYDKDDDIYEEYRNNTVISMTVDEFIKKDRRMAGICEMVNDIVEFNKNKYIFDFSEIINRLNKSISQEQALNNLNLKLAKKQNTLLSQQLEVNTYTEKVLENMTPEEVASMNKKLLSGEYDANSLMDLAMDKYLKNDVRKKETVINESEKVINFTDNQG